MALLDLSLHLKFAGATLIFLALSHLFFDKRFNWRAETARMSLLNRQIFYVHTFFVALSVGLMGAIALFGTRALLQPTLAASWMCGGFALFWACRLWCQFFVYDASLWRGQRFETAIHILFSLAWSYYIGVFGWAWWRQIW